MKRHRTRYPGVTFRLTVKGERRYSIDYEDSNGKRVVKIVPGGEKDALRERNLILERMHRGEKVVRSRMTVEELAEDYLRTQTGHVRDSTFKTYDYSLTKWVIPNLGTRKISTVDVSDMADFIATLRQTMTADTIRTCLTPMSRMFQYAVRKGWMSSNPVAQLDKQERPKGSVKHMRILSSEEISRLLAVRFGQRKKTPSVYRLLFMTAIFAGLRRGELLRLDWEDVDLNASELHVRDGKTAAAKRTVVLPDFLVQELAKASLKIDAPTGEEKLIALMENRDEPSSSRYETRVFPFDVRNCNRALENALEKAGIEHIRFHDLRHTFASILISMGCDLPYVAQQIGHASPATTLSVYSHLFDGQKRQEEAKVKMQEAFKEVVG